MVITDAALSSVAAFLVLACVFFILYSVAWLGRWPLLSQNCFFWACLIALALVFFFLFCPWFHEPVGGWIMEKTTTLCKLIRPDRLL